MGSPAERRVQFWDGFAGGVSLGLLLVAVAFAGVSAWNKGVDVTDIGSSRGFVANAGEVSTVCGRSFVAIFDAESSAWAVRSSIHIPKHLEEAAASAVGKNATIDYQVLDRDSFLLDARCETYTEAIRIREVEP